MITSARTSAVMNRINSLETSAYLCETLTVTLDQAPSKRTGYNRAGDYYIFESSVVTDYSITKVLGEDWPIGSSVDDSDHVGWYQTPTDKGTFDSDYPDNGNAGFNYYDQTSVFNNVGFESPITHPDYYDEDSFSHYRIQALVSNSISGVSSTVDESPSNYRFSASTSAGAMPSYDSYAGCRVIGGVDGNYLFTMASNSTTPPRGDPGDPEPPTGRIFHQAGLYVGTDIENATEIHRWDYHDAYPLGNQGEDDSYQEAMEDGDFAGCLTAMEYQNHSGTPMLLTVEYEVAESTQYNHRFSPAVVDVDSYLVLRSAGGALVRRILWVMQTGGAGVPASAYQRIMGAFTIAPGIIIVLSRSISHNYGRASVYNESLHWLGNITIPDPGSVSHWSPSGPVNALTGASSYACAMGQSDYNGMCCFSQTRYQEVSGVNQDQSHRLSILPWSPTLTSWNTYSPTTISLGTFPSAQALAGAYPHHTEVKDMQDALTDLAECFMNSATITAFTASSLLTKVVGQSTWDYPASSNMVTWDLILTNLEDVCTELEASRLTGLSLY